MDQDDERDEQEVRKHVSAASHHDPDSWEWLYRRSYPAMFAYARRRLSSDSAADDAVSEAMTRAIENIGRFRWKRAGFDGWVLGILRNVVYETYRESGRKPPPAAAIQGDGIPDDPADIVDERTSGDLALNAFSRLDPQEQELIELRVIAELSVADVAAVLGKRQGAVRMAQSRAVGRLRAFMEEESRG